MKEAVQYIIYLTKYLLDLQGQNEKKSWKEKKNI